MRTSPPVQSENDAVELARLHAGIEAALSPVAVDAPAPSPEELTPIPPLVREVPVSAWVAPDPNVRLPADAIRRVVRQAAGKFRGCALQRHPDAHGRVDVRFTIGPDGAVSVAREENVTLPDRALRRCILETFFELRFPVPPGQVIEVSYPLVFAEGERPVELREAARVAQKPPPGFEEAYRAGRPVPGLAPTRHESEQSPKPASSCPSGDPMCPEL